MALKKRKAPDVLSFFVKANPSKLTTYGVNFILSVSCPRPDTWIVDKLLAPDISQRVGKTLVGGGGYLKLSEGDALMRIKFDPTEKGVMTVDFNVSRKADDLPAPDVLRQQQSKDFSSLMGILERLGF